ncbi:MAG: Bacterial transcription activator, effector binding domain [Phycisphaerales bacterium]|nr:Bacterial transcription activator, effector binding domain [Phycisphaerales bacterium]
MGYDVRVENFVGEIWTAVVRRRAGFSELAKVVPDACGVVWKVIQSQQIKGAGRHVALYLDDVINLEVGVEMAEAFAGCGEVIGSALPAGQVARAVHMGPYQRLHFAHVAIRDWCAKQGHAMAGPNWEIYGHWEEAWNSDPSLIRTEVFYLLGAGKAG